MVRTIIMALIALMLVACGKKDEAGAPSDGASPAPFDAFIEYDGRRYEMVVHGDCGAKPDGTYLTWAVTLDDDGKVVGSQAHMYAMRRAYWSVIDFYYPEEDRIVRIYREGGGRFGFEDGVLEFDGELGAGITERAHVRIDCQAQAMRTSEQE